MLKPRIDAALKQALLSGDKETATTLRGLKSAILYEEVAAGKKDEGLDEAATQAVLMREAKKRQESADLYRQGGNQEKAKTEETEKALIETFLPEQMSPDDLSKLVSEQIAKTGASTQADMGKVISAVRAEAGASTDGAAIANEVKKQLGV